MNSRSIEQLQKEKRGYKKKKKRVQFIVHRFDNSSRLNPTPTLREDRAETKQTDYNIIRGMEKDSGAKERKKKGKERSR